VAAVCRLTPVVFDELYKIMASPEHSRRFRSEETLEGLGLTHAHPRRLHRRYSGLARRYLEQARVLGDEASAPWARLAQWHAELASWLLTAGVGAPHDVDGILATAVADCYDRFHIEQPLNARPVIHGWTLGHEVHHNSPRIPAIPALWPLDTNVSMAYEGLVEHVVGLRNQSNPLPELASTAVAWRVGGLVENLWGVRDTLRNQFNGLLGRCGSVLDAAQRARLYELWGWFDDSRHVLTHFRRSDAGRTFETEAPRYREAGYGDAAVEAATVFVFRQAALDATDISDDDAFRRLGGWVARVNSDLDNAALEQSS
jgi:hypothetical protein